MADVIRSAAGRLTASPGEEPEAMAQIAASLRGFADSLEEETADTLIEAVETIARANPSTFLAGSVMAGFALEQVARGEDEAAGGGEAPQAGAGFFEQVLSLFRDSLEGKAEADIAEAGRHPLPLALAAVSIAWLLAQARAERETPGAAGDSVPAEPDAGRQGRPPPPREAAVAPGGMGYLMTLSPEEEEQIEWGSHDVT